MSPAAASHFALGTPPTQKMVLCLVLSASQKRLKSSAAMIGFGCVTRSAPKWLANKLRRRSEKGEVLNVASADGCSISTVGRGKFSARIDKSGQKITYKLTYTLENPATVAHLHFAQQHVAALLELAVGREDVAALVQDDVGRAEPRAECAERAVRARVRVAAGDRADPLDGREDPEERRLLAERGDDGEDRAPATRREAPSSRAARRRRLCWNARTTAPTWSS